MMWGGVEGGRGGCTCDDGRGYGKVVQYSTNVHTISLYAGLDSAHAPETP